MPYTFKLSKRLARAPLTMLFAATAFTAACDAPRPAPVEPGVDTLRADALRTSKPGTVGDLAVTAVTDSSATLSFTEVTGGNGQPASYDMRFAVSPISWGSAADVAQGSCKAPMAGTATGAKRSCTVFGLTASTNYQFQVVAFRGTLNVNAVFGLLSSVASGTTAQRVGVPVPVASVTVSPASAGIVVAGTQQLTAVVKDASGSILTGRTVTWASSTPSVATVSATGMVTAVAPGAATITAMSEGQGGSAAITVTAPVAPVASVTVSPAAANVGVAGTQQLSAVLKDAAGNVLSGRSITWSSSAPLVVLAGANGLVTGLLPGTATISAVSEGKTGTASITVTVVASGGVVFQSDWSAGTGTSVSAVTDGNRWGQYDEFNGGQPVQLLSVVPGAGPGGSNALKVVQRGSSFAANLQQRNILPPSTDYYVRFYMRNDDTSPSGDHIVTPDIYQYANLTYIRKSSSAAGWNVTSSFYGLGYVYPIGHWTLGQQLAHGVWYRFEYYVHFVTAVTMQVRIRIYDASGAQIASEANFNQSDPGSQAWNGKSDWNLASYYQAGYTFGVDPVPLTTFGVGNNGQYAAIDTGLPWYFAGVQIRTDRWPGP